jgi:hypothetical protein
MSREEQQGQEQDSPRDAAALMEIFWQQGFIS